MENIDFYFHITCFYLLISFPLYLRRNQVKLLLRLRNSHSIHVLKLWLRKKSKINNLHWLVISKHNNDEHPLWNYLTDAQFLLHLNMQMITQRCASQKRLHLNELNHLFNAYNILCPFYVFNCIHFDHLSVDFLWDIINSNNNQ